MTNLYVVDTSSLIDLQENYPHGLFPTVWNNFESLIRTNRMISPIEVKKEISSGNEFLYNWCQKNRGIFIENNSQILTHVPKIMARFPKIVDPNKTGPVADPFIIALALFYKNGISGQEPVILTQERNRENRIPFVADHYNVSSLNLLELFNAENWTF